MLAEHDDIQIISIRLHIKTITELDHLADENRTRFKDRSSVIRTAIQEYLTKPKCEQCKTLNPKEADYCMNCGKQLRPTTTQ